MFKVNFVVKLLLFCQGKQLEEYTSIYRGANYIYIAGYPYYTANSQIFAEVKCLGI